MAPMRLILPVTPLFVLALAACSDGAGVGGVGEVVVRDSAGITIVENPAGSEDAAPEWVVDPTPIVRIGVVTGDPVYQFGRIDGVTQLADGRLVALDGQARELRYFTPEGVHLFSAGGSGEGPGEIFPTGVARIFPLPGDTLAVLSLQRLTLFDTNGEFVETVTSQNPAPLGLLDRRAVIVWQSRAVTDIGGPDGLTGQGNDYVRVDLMGEQPDSALTFKLSRRSWSSEGTTMITATGPDGQSMQIPVPGLGVHVPFTHPPISYVRVGGFAITDWQSHEIEVFDGSGRLTRIVRIAGPLEPLTEEVFRARVERVLSAMEPEVRESQEAAYAAMPSPPTIPAWAPASVSGMNRMLMGADGEIWIGRFDPEEDLSHFPGSNPLVWTAFDPEGRVVGTVRMPERFSAFELTPEGVLGVYRDEFDVEYVQHVRVERQPAP